MRYECINCGAKFSSWFGRCPECGEWESIEEIKVKSKKEKIKPAKVFKLSEIEGERQEQRLKSGIAEFDRVLGGGIVKGEVILLTGQPGIGKSTLLLNVASGFKSLYVSAEESLLQIKERIKNFSLKKDNIYFTEEKQIEKILALLEKEKFELVIIDSLQTVFSNQLDNPPGSISQLKQVLQEVLEKAKEKGIAFILIGHLTKSGEFAGPKALEHMVDCVLYVEGDRQLPYRILTCTKNRFGPTDEIGMFEMTSKGLKEFFDPLVFVEKEESDEVGRAKVVEIKGPRVLFYEVQALVVPTFLAMPRRVSKGIDQKRLLLLLAVMRKYLRLPLEKFDIYVSTVGGVNLTSSLADLGVVVAVYSSLKNKKLPSDWLFAGEVDLLGKIRRESRIEKIEKEAKRLGFSKVFSGKILKTLIQLPQIFSL